MTEAIPAETSENDIPTESQESKENPKNSIPENSVLHYPDEPIDPRHYHRIGFICAISNRENPENNLKQIIAEHQKRIGELLAQLQTLFTIESANINRQTDNIKAIISEDQLKLLNLQQETIELKALQIALKEKLETLERELSAVYNDFGQRKEKMIELRIDEVRKELIKIIENYNKTCEERNEINKRDYEINKSAIDKRISILETFISRNKEAYNRLSTRLLPLSERGISEKSVNLLLSFCFPAAIGAGWFFSIYALNQSFGNKDGIGFVLEGLFRFGSTLMDKLGSEIIGIPVLILSLLAFITVTGGVAWIAQKVIDNYNSSSTNIKIEFETDEYLRFLLRTKITATNFISFWMQLSPYVFIGGVVYILLIAGKAGQEIEVVSASLSAHTVGSFITLLTAGVSMLYIMKVVEPRVEAQGNKPHVWIRSNIELGVVMFLFIAFIILLTTGIPGKTAIVPVTGFAIVTILTGVLMGYALRFKALITQVKDLEFQTERFAIEVQKLSRPKPLFIEYDEGRQFNKKFIDLERELLELSIFKSRQATLLWQNQAVKRVKKHGYWDRFLKRLLAGEKNISVYDEEAYYNLSAGEERFFPSVSTKIEELKNKINATKASLAENISQHTHIKEETSVYAIKLKNSIQEARRKIDELEQKLIDYRKSFFKKSEALQLEKEQYENHIRDGFDVGMWYRINKLGPSSDYYSTSITIKPLPNE
jgi:hypothetical protein